MSYGTVAEADVALGHLPAWSALDVEVKQARMDGATLWLEASYTGIDGLPLGISISRLDEVPASLKTAELVAVRWALTVPLFPEPQAPGQSGQGPITKLKRKVDVLETETTWAEPVDGVVTDGPVRIAEVDALLIGIAIRTGSVKPLPVAFVV